MKDIKEIANKIKQKGGNLYLVGGAVRDELLGIINHDEDYCVTGISPEEFKEFFPQAIFKGKDFPVFSIDDKEFAIARRERKIGLGHDCFDIETDKKITIEDDLKRRDITINAIAKEVLTGKIIDPFNGIEDLKKKKIRAVSDHFKEDPLRVYRVARFASQFDFQVENNTLNMMQSLKKELSTLSVERVNYELKKALLANKPSNFFNILKKAYILDIHFKEIYNLIGAEQPKVYHPEGDSYNHTMIVLNKVAESTKNLDDERKIELRFSALVHDIGKGVTPKEEYPHHFNHEENGVQLVRIMGKRLKLQSRLIKCGETACIEHMRGGLFDKMTPSKKVSFVERVNKTILGLDGLQIIVDADNMSENKKVNQFKDVGQEILNCTNGSKIMKEYGLNQGIQVAYKMHEIRVLYLKNKYKLKRGDNF